MNPNTGEIKSFPNAKEAIKEGFTIPLESLPKKNCKHWSRAIDTGRVIRGREKFNRKIVNYKKTNT